MNFEASEVPSKFDMNQTFLPYPVCELKTHYAANKKRRFPTQGHMKYLRQCETGALLNSKNRSRCTWRRGSKCLFAFTSYEMCVSQSREKSKVRGKISQAAVSFPWPNWNYLHICLYPVSLWLSACVQLETWGQVCLLLKGPFHMGSLSCISDLPQSDAILLISPH